MEEFSPLPPFYFLIPLFYLFFTSSHFDMCVLGVIVKPSVSPMEYVVCMYEFSCLIIHVARLGVPFYVYAKSCVSGFAPAQTTPLQGEWVW